MATPQQRASGTFEVKIAPATEPQAFAEGVTLGRATLHKTFAGELVGTSAGEMLTARTGVPGSAGYVAIERVEGTLRQRHGSFVLQHGGIMNRGAQSLTVTIVPDTGAGELAGIAGTLAIRIEQGVHYYDLEYTLPA